MLRRSFLIALGLALQGTWLVPAMEPDLILDVGSVDDTNTSLADGCAFTPLAPPQPGDIQTGQSG